MKTIGDRTIPKIGRAINGQLHLDRRGNHRNTVFLAGSGRSGTTWVADIINYRNEYRYIFEPFHRHKVQICRDFRYRQYLRPDDRDRTYLEPASRIVSGRIRSLWADRYNRKVVSSRRLVKDVRANLLLGWLRANFEGMPIVLLLRHPCAVADSRLRVDWQGGADLWTFLDQPALMEDHLEAFRAELSSARTDFERMVLFWCAENYVPLRQFRRGEIHVVFYEDLCVDPDREIARLFTYLGTHVDPASMAGVERPSASTRTDSAIVSGGSLVDAWTANITPAQVERANEILVLFGLDRVYSSGPMPVPLTADEAFAR